MSFPLKQMIKYGIAGGTAAAAHLGILFILVTYHEIPKINASNIGFLCAMIINYSVQNFYVFPNNLNKISSSLKYTLVTLAFFFLNAYLFNFLLDYTEVNYMFCQIAVIIFIFLFNFIINKFFTFRI